MPLIFQQQSRLRDTVSGGTNWLAGVLAVEDGTFCHIPFWRLHMKEIKGDMRMCLKFPGKAQRKQNMIIPLEP